MRIRLTRAHTKLNDALHALADDPDNNTLNQRVRRAEASVAEHAALYDSTPAGQNELRDAIAHEDNDTSRNLLNQRLAAAEALRAQQIQTMHNSQQDQQQRTITMSNEPTLTQQQREAFWRLHGWRPDLPDSKRREIEKYWTDPEIVEAEALGF
ncbi:hypothetical protein [Rhodococcus koreensis]|uniref:hypothetical protein n=1 Tax=Rhodococcus koreensis TaxID=99653 RepID=UPI00366E2CF3